MVKKAGETMGKDGLSFCEKEDIRTLVFRFSTILFLFSTGFSTFCLALPYLGFPLLNISTNTTYIKVK